MFERGFLGGVGKVEAGKERAVIVVALLMLLKIMWLVL